MSDQPMDDQSGTDRQKPPEPQQVGYRSGTNDGGRSPDELGDALDNAPPVLVRAEAHLRSPLLDAPPPPLSQQDHGDRIPSIAIPAAIGPYAVLVIAVAIAVAIAVSLAANAGLGLTAGVITAAAVVMRSVARRVAFGFGDGFIAFRQGDEWPHGVQEEYDVHYSWPSTAQGFARSGGR
jgi:hypothetical protein